MFVRHEYFVCLFLIIIIIERYASPLIDLLDIEGVIKQRYYREHCTKRRGRYAKDLTVIRKDLSQIFLLDNSPYAYSLNPTNGIPISSWFASDPNDKELLIILPFLRAIRCVEGKLEFYKLI